MTSTNYLDCELYLSAPDQARLSADGRECAGRPALDKALERRLLATASPTEYGTLLFDALFPAADNDLLAGYREALVVAEESARRLRFRLHVATTAPPWLHRLQWELLYDPKRRLALGRSRDIALSRYLSVSTTRPPAVDRPRLLVVVASPGDLADYQLAELDEARLRTTLEHALSPLPESVSWEFLEPPATLSRIRDRMVAGGFHALHLQAHGLRRRDRAVAHLVLEDDQRQAAFIDEELFAEIFEGQRELRLVTLIACHGGTPVAVDPFSGLGPALVRQGIAAVVAMQRAISVDAASRFSERFYSDLARNGHIDAAAAEARLHLHLADPQGVEWGTPALFMRLSQGRLWRPADTSIDTQKLVHSGTDGFLVPAAVAEQRTTTRRRRTIRGAVALALMLLGVLAAVFGRGLMAPDLGLGGPPRIAVLGLRELPTAAPEPWIVTTVEELLAHDLNTSPGIEVIPATGSAADDPETVQQLGEETGANIVLSGQVAVGADGDVRIVVRLQSIETGKIADLSATGDAPGLLEMTARLADKVLYTLGVEATASPDSGSQPEPVSPKARQLYAQAQAALRVLDAPAAKKALDEAIRLAPEHPKLRAARAEVQGLLGNAGEAERQAQLALVQARQWSREAQLFIRVLLLEARREWTKAAAVSRALSASDARPQEADFEDDLRLARLLIRGGQQRQVEEAIEILQRLEGPATDDLRILLLRADAARVRSEWDRQLELTRRVIDRAGEGDAPLILAKARELRAVALRRQGRLDEARVEAEAARELYDTHRHRGGEAEAWNTLGSVFLDQRNLAAAKSSFERASSLFEELGQRRMAAKIRTNLSMSLAALGEFETAIEGYRRALKLLEGTGNPTDEAGTLLNLAISLSELGRLPEATAVLKDAEALVDEIEPAWRAYARRVFAQHYLQLGLLGKMGPELESAMAIAKSLEHSRAIAETLLLRARLREFHGELAAAEDLYLQALEICDQSEDTRLHAAVALRGLAGVALLQGDLDEARRFYARILEIETTSSTPAPETARNRLLQVRLLIEEGSLADAEAAAATAVRIFAQRRATLDESLARNAVARVLLTAGRLKEAERQVDRARELLGDLETPIYRLPVNLTAARILIARGADSEARELLQSSLMEATVNERFSEWEYEARLALGEIDLRSGGTDRLVSVENEARQKGYVFLAERAARLLKQAAI